MMWKDTTTITKTPEAITKATWVKNLSSFPLTEALECHPAHGPNFAIATQCPPNSKYIAVVEQACQKITQGEADELWVEVKECSKAPKKKKKKNKTQHHQQ